MATKPRRKKRAARRGRRQNQRPVTRGPRLPPVAPAAATQEPVNIKDNVVEDALRSGEHSGVLEDYFGPAQYAELKRLSQDAAQRRVRGGERVLILPGIMGS